MPPCRSPPTRVPSIAGTRRPARPVAAWPARRPPRGTSPPARRVTRTVEALELPPQDRYHFVTANQRLGDGNPDELECLLTSFRKLLLHRGRLLRSEQTVFVF